MSSSILYPNGLVVVTLLAAESIAVFTRGLAQVYQRIGYPAFPSNDSFLGEVNNEQVTFGPYASGATIVIQAGASPVLYQQGTAPVITETRNSQYQPTPVALNATGAVTAAAILGGIVTSTTAAAVAGTVPTGTVMDAASQFDVDDSVDWAVINTGANTFTVTAATDHTLVGGGAVATATSGYFRTRKTAANTFVTYRIG